MLDAKAQPIGEVLRILEERGFERAKRALEEAKNPDDVKSTLMVQLVKSFRTDAWGDRMRELSEYKV